MTLPIRPAGPQLTPLPAALEEGPAERGGLPVLRGTLPQPAPQALVLLLRVHNGAGIPIVEGSGSVAAGQTELVIDSLRPLGIEGYAHVNDERRAEVAQRVWSRRRYGTVSVRGG